MKRIRNWIKRKYKKFFVVLLAGCVLVALFVFQNESNHTITIVDSDIGDEVKEVKVNGDYSIFDETYQQNVLALILKQLVNTSVENPFLIYNPFGTNYNAVNVYFNEQIKSLDYTIYVDGYATYSQKLQVDEEDGYQIIGLISGETNRLVLNVDDYSYTYILDMPKTNSDADNQLEVTEGTSQEEICDGLYAMLGKDTRSNIFLYDNDGVLRSELVVDDTNYRSDRILTIDDHLVYTYSKEGFLFVNRQGMIERILNLKGFYMHHDFIYDEENHNLLILANENDTDTIEDVIVSLNLDTGKTEKLVDMKDLLPEMYETAYDEDGENTYGGDELDWLHLNSLSLMDDGSLLVSSRELSTIIKLDNIYTKPSIDYMIGDDSIYENFEYQDLLLSKDGDFISQAGQHTVTYCKDDSLDDGCYYVTIFNNNYGNMATRQGYDWSNIEGVGTYKNGTNSYFYKYLVNENERTYQLIQSIALPYSPIVSSIEYYENHIQTSSGVDCSFAEYDENGELIRQYDYQAENYAYRVMKYSFALWFQ